ncbi:MAG: glycosyltransferase family 4 protein [bacterium]
MKILFLNHNLIWRGTFFRCLGFARELVKRGHEAELWTAARDPHGRGIHLEEDGVRIWQTPRWGRLGGHDGGYAPVDNLARLIRACRCDWDVVHAFDHRPNVLLPWLWIRFRRRVLGRHSTPLFVSDWCDWWTGGGITTGRRAWPAVDRIERRIEEGSKRMADGVTVISSVLYQRARNVGIPEERLLLLPSGVAVERFPMLDKLECRRRLGWPLDRPGLGFVGYSLWDLEMLAETFRLVQKEHPRVFLVVIGGGVEEQAKDIFRKYFSIGQDVFLPGVVSFAEVPMYLASCDVHLLPMQNNLANRARLPNKLCDYFASGRPAAVSDVGEAADYVRRYQTGLVGGKTAESLAQACVQLLNDPSLAETCGRQARRIAETGLAYSTLTDSLLDFYQKRMKGEGDP